MKAIYKTIAIVLLSGTGIGSIQAQNTTSQAWTLRQCIDYAIEHNIDIRQTANEAEQNKIRRNRPCQSIFTPFPENRDPQKYKNAAA